MSTAAVKVLISGDAKGASKALKQVRDDSKKTGSAFKNIAKVGGAGLLAVGAIGVGIAAASVKAAVEDQKSAAILKNTLQKTTGATKAQVAATEDWIDKTQRATGVADDELRPALGGLLRVTKDAKKAQDLLTLAMDVSAATGKPLAAVSAALAKGYNGSTGALGKLGIKTKDAAGKALAFKDITKQLAASMGGATATAANTLEGKMKRADIAFSEVKEKIGYKLIPVLTALASFMTDKLIPAIETTVNWVVANWPKVQNVIVTTVRFIRQVVSTVLEAIRLFWAAWGGRITSLVRGVFGGISKYIGGIMQVIRGIIKVVTSLIHGDFSGAWNGIKQIIFGVWQSIKGIIQTAVTIVKTTLSTAWALVRNTVTDKFNAIVNFFKGIPSRVGSALSTVGEVLLSPFRTAFGMIARLWNDTVGKLFHGQKFGKVLGFGGITLPDLRIPGYATGGVVPGDKGRPSLAVVHGGETIFTPAQMRALAGVGGGGRAGNVYITLPAGTDPAAVVRAQKRHARRNGTA